MARVVAGESFGERWRSAKGARKRWRVAFRSRQGSLWSGVRAYRRYRGSWRAYARIEGAEPLRFRDSHPCLFDRVPTTPYDPHYFHQATWAMSRILATLPEEHVDVGSEVNFVGMVSAAVPVAFVDIRPLPVELPRLRCLTGDLLRLPFSDASVSSLSCLHVAEHVGLGRYGDELAPDGTRSACAELARVLAPGGMLLVSLPVGRSRVCFNAHRVHTPAQIIEYLAPLALVEFSVVDDEYRLVTDADPVAAAELRYGCGLFRFERR